MTPRSRGPAVVHTALLGVLVLLVATVALVVRAPSPPSISEFAPQAVEQIKRAPDSQSSRFGQGRSGACVSAASCPRGVPTDRPTAGASPTASPEATVEVPRVHLCPGSPPRQILDPQSPPCVPYWKGDNGGATTRGVTGTTITVAYPSTIGPPSSQTLSMVAFFNERFELYGRKIVLRELHTGGLYDTATPATMHAAAVQADSELQAFASLSFPSYSANAQDSYYYDELARRQILSVTSDDSFRTEKDNFDAPELESYEWSFLPSLDGLEQDTARLVCTSLVGRPPSHAGSPITPGQLQAPASRKFGVVQASNYSTAVDLTALRQVLGSCGVHPEVQVVDVKATDGQLQGVAGRFANDGVTTVICVCYSYLVGGMQKNATTIQYQPEWVQIGAASAVDDGNANPSVFSQASHTFGVYGLNKINPVAQEPWFWALKAEDPQQDASSQVNPASLGTQLFNLEVYQELLLLASGIQAAGPNLSAASFRDGLMATAFPNPGAAGPPYYQATVGFSPGDHVMTDDVALGYFDPSVTSDETGKSGTFCLLGRGMRFRPTTWRRVPDGDFYTGGGRPASVPCK